MNTRTLSRRLDGAAGSEDHGTGRGAASRKRLVLPVLALAAFGLSACAGGKASQRPSSGPGGTPGTTSSSEVSPGGISSGDLSSGGISSGADDRGRGQAAPSFGRPAGSPGAAPSFEPPQPPTLPTAQVRPLPAVAPQGIVPQSDEEAERLHQELDALPETASERPGRRQTLIDYYAAGARSALQRGDADEAFDQFSHALPLFEPAELQDPTRPPTQPGLFEVAQQLDRLFSRRGAHPQVITAQIVQRTLRPDDPVAFQRYKQLADWLRAQSDQVQNLLRGRGRSLGALLAEPPATLASDLEGAYRLFPSWAARRDLVELYRAEAAGSLEGKRNPREFLQSLSASLRRKGLLNGPAFKIARLFLRVSQPQQAVAELKRLAHRSGEEGRLQDLIEETLASPDSSDERMLGAVKLAMGLAQNPEDAEVSLQICRDAALRAPKLVPAEMCVAELAIALERKGLARRSLERARALAPDDKQVWERLGALYVDHLSDLVSDERVGDLEAELQRIEVYYQSLQAKFSEGSSGPGVALALAEVGRGFYNAGRVEDARKYLEKSVAVKANAQALELLGLLQLRRGRAQAAIPVLEQARALQLNAQHLEPLQRSFYHARIGRLIAEAHEQLPGGQKQAAEVRKASLVRFDQVIVSGKLSGERLGEAELERGKILYQSGDREAALSALRKAADAVASGEDEKNGPSRGQGQLLADELAFLVQRGEVELSRETYHRALQHPRLGESLKVYCSLWINDLLERSGQPADPLALSFLRSIRGAPRWHVELARWALGQIPDAELLKRADTPGKQAEATFYLSMARLRAGDKAQAEALWRKVVASNMVSFFEFEMSTTYLARHGAPTSPVLQPKPGKAPAPPSKRPNPLVTR
jgi:tetratricopeptide (TPR) repeat protein